MGPILEGEPTAGGAWAAVLLVSASTLAGAWLARRNSARVTVWLAIASSMMLVTALADLLPDAWSDAVESGVPLWGVGLAIAFGFLVITYFTRKGCVCPAINRPHIARHAPGRHRRVKEAVGAALFGGMGTAAALTTHRAIEGATLALTASVVVVLALMVHSASEGLALAALLGMARQRLAPWLVVSCASPAVGVVVAKVSPLPGKAVPILLGMVTGVLLRTAIVGLKLAAGSQENGRLSRRHMAVAAAISITSGALLVAAHGLHDHDDHDEMDAISAVGTIGGVGGIGAIARMTHSRSIAGPDGPGEPSTPRGPHEGEVVPSSGPDGSSVRPASAPVNGEELRAAVTAGRLSLAEVLGRDDEVTRSAPVVGILQALPGRSPAEVDALMAASGIDEDHRVGDLTEPQRRSLLDAFAD